MSQGAPSFLSSNPSDPENPNQAEDPLFSSPYSTISHHRYDVDSSSVHSAQIEMQQGLNDHLSQGSMMSAKRRQSEAGNCEPRLSYRDTYSGFSGTFSENKESFLTDNIRKTMDPKNIKVIEEREEEDGESTEPDSDRSVKKFQEQFALPLHMVSISSQAISEEKLKRLQALNRKIRKGLRNLVIWQRSWSFIVLEHRRLGQRLWAKLEKMLKETIENMKINKENQLNSKEMMAEIEGIIDDLKKGLLWAKGKYEKFIWRFRIDEKVENAVKTFQENCEVFLKRYEAIEGGLYTKEMMMIFQVENQAFIEEEFGKEMTGILEGVKEIEERAYRRFSRMEISGKMDLKERYLPRNLLDFEGEYEGLVELLGFRKFKISKDVEKSSLLLYTCQVVLWEKKKKVKENAVRIGLTADMRIIVFEIIGKVEILRQWSWSSVEIEEHIENEDMVVIGKCWIEFDDVLGKKGFLSRFEQWRIQ